MKRLLPLFTMLLMLLIVACSGASDDPAPDPTDRPVELPDPQSQEADVVLEVRGESTISAERDAAVFCEPGTPDVIRLTVVGGGDQIYLTVPADTTGIAEIVGTDDATDASVLSVNYRNNVTNYGTGTGEIEVINVPAAAGESFVAILNIDLTANNGNTITVAASFNADTDAATFADC